MTALPPSLAAELDALRERAYGREADIDSDAAALARLRALEREVAGAPSANVTVAETDDAPATDRSTPVAPEPATSREWWRRPVLWAVAISTVVVLALGAAVITATASRPDLTMTPSGAASRPYFPESLEWLTSSIGMQRDRLVPYEGFGRTLVWAGESDDGVRCLLVTVDGGAVGYGCARDGVAPTADVVIDDNRTEAFTGFAQRSTMRFVFHGDRVEVWVAQP